MESLIKRSIFKLGVRSFSNKKSTVNLASKLAQTESILIVDEDD